LCNVSVGSKLERLEDKWFSSAFLADLDLIASMDTLPKKTVLPNFSVSGAFTGNELLSDSCCGFGSIDTALRASEATFSGKLSWPNALARVIGEDRA
jgi:hypothetical protein